MDPLRSPTPDAASMPGGAEDGISWMYILGGVLAGFAILSVLKELSMVGWKWALIGPGIALLAAPDVIVDHSKQKFLAYLAPVGAILVSVGLVLVYTLRTGNHIAWAYSWLLIVGDIVLSVDRMGLFINMEYHSRLILRRVGLFLLAVYAVVGLVLGHTFPVVVVAGTVAVPVVVRYLSTGKLAMFDY